MFSAASPKQQNSCKEVPPRRRLPNESKGTLQRNACAPQKKGNGKQNKSQKKHSTTSQPLDGFPFSFSFCFGFAFPSAASFLSPSDGLSSFFPQYQRIPPPYIPAPAMGAHRDMPFVAMGMPYPKPAAGPAKPLMQHGVIAMREVLAPIVGIASEPLAKGQEGKADKAEKINPHSR
jgi:hypothetical protein